MADIITIAVVLSVLFTAFGAGYFTGAAHRDIKWRKKELQEREDHESKAPHPERQYSDAEIDETIKFHGGS